MPSHARARPMPTPRPRRRSGGRGRGGGGARRGGAGRRGGGGSGAPQTPHPRCLGARLGGTCGGYLATACAWPVSLAGRTGPPSLAAVPVRCQPVSGWLEATPHGAHPPRPCTPTRRAHRTTIAHERASSRLVRGRAQVGEVRATLQALQLTVHRPRPARQPRGVCTPSMEIQIGTATSSPDRPIRCR